MSKFYQTFQSPYSLHNPPYYLSVSEFVLKSTKTSSFFWIFFCRNSSLTKTILYFLSTKRDWSISLFLISITLHISQPFHHGCCWRKNKLRVSMKTLLLIITKSPKVRKFCFSVHFLYFVFLVFLFWLIDSTTKNLQGLTLSNPSRRTNQVTLSNEHINLLFWK